MHDFNPSTLETEAGIFLNSRPVWSIEKVIEQPRLFIEQGYSGKQNIKQNKINNNKKKTFTNWVDLPADVTSYVDKDREPIKT